jgi:hypothetical protein
MKGYNITKGFDVLDKLKKHRDTYNDKGKYLGFQSIENHYSMMLGTCTDWTGQPTSGKTQVLMELLLNTSKYYGWKHLVYFPDVGTNIEVIADLMHKLTGKTFDPKYKNVITDEEIGRELEWICHHFKILTKEDNSATMTPFEFWDYAVEVQKTEGIQTACIDSWKDMYHDYKKYGSYATYLEVVLPYRNKLAEDHKLHFHTIIHPSKIEKENGKRPPVTPHNLKGGSEWYNSGKCMITVHREDPEGIEVELHYHKMKPRAAGSKGMSRLQFDVGKLVYYEENELGNKIYSAPKGESKTEFTAPSKDYMPSWNELDKDELPF